MVLDNFRRGRGNILVATDVAARGLDIPGVAAVLVYDFPLQVEDYVHRIGRTGRAGKEGKAFTFFTKDNRGAANELIDILQGAGQTVPLALQAMQRKGGGGGGRPRLVGRPRRRQRTAARRRPRRRQRRRRQILARQQKVVIVFASHSFAHYYIRVLKS